LILSPFRWLVPLVDDCEVVKVFTDRLVGPVHKPFFVARDLLRSEVSAVMRSQKGLQAVGGRFWFGLIKRSYAC